MESVLFLVIFIKADTSLSCKTEEVRGEEEEENLRTPTKPTRESSFSSKVASPASRWIPQFFLS
jgi:hypothetical protein